MRSLSLDTRLSSCDCCNLFGFRLIALHRHLHVAGDLAVQLHGNVVLTDRLQRLVQGDLAALDGETLGLKLVRDIARGHRAGEVFVLADLALGYELDLCERPGPPLSP